MPRVNSTTRLMVAVDWSPVSESNQRDHWSAKHRRAKAARAAWEEATSSPEVQERLREVARRLSG